MGGGPSPPAPGSALRPSRLPGVLPWPEQPSGRPARPAPATGEGFEPVWLAPGPPGPRRPRAGPPSQLEPRLGRALLLSWSSDRPGPAEGGECSGAPMLLLVPFSWPPKLSPKPTPFLSTPQSRTLSAHMDTPKPLYSHLPSPHHTFIPTQYPSSHTAALPPPSSCIPTPQAVG